MHARTHTNTHARAPTNTHTHIYTHTHTHTLTHTHKHAPNADYERQQKGHNYTVMHANIHKFAAKIMEMAVPS